MTILERLERLENALGIGAPEPSAITTPVSRSARLLELWWGAHGSEWVTSSEIRPLVETYAERSDLSARKVYSILRPLHGFTAAVNGKVMKVCMGSRSNTAVWRLVER